MPAEYAQTATTFIANFACQWPAHRASLLQMDGPALQRRACLAGFCSPTPCLQSQLQAPRRTPGTSPVSFGWGNPWRSGRRLNEPVGHRQG